MVKCDIKREQIYLVNYQNPENIFTFKTPKGSVGIVKLPKESVNVCTLK